MPCIFRGGPRWRYIVFTRCLAFWRAQAKLRHHEHNLVRKRLRQIEWRTGARDDSLRSELSSRVDEAEKRAKELSNMLAKQKVAFDMLQVSSMSQWRSGTEVTDARPRRSDLPTRYPVGWNLIIRR